MTELNVPDARHGPARNASANRATDSQEALSRLLLLARADLARELTEDADPDQLIARVASLASRLIPGAQGCVIALSSAESPMEVLTATTVLGSELVRAEVEAGQGPSSDAIGRHGTVRIDDPLAETRWPSFVQRLVPLGVLSLAGCDLPVTRRARGVLMVYSAEAAAFDDVAELMLPVFASRASIALGYRDAVQNLTRAIDSRELVGQAVGILMERHRLSAKAAFDELVRASQASQIKLHLIAKRVIATGQEPNETFS